ncbi:MAG: PDZ domain-containing protein [Planctomycetota bacterium]
MTLARLTLAAAAILFLSNPSFADPGYLGVYLTDESESTQGAVIEDVAPGSPAAKAGVRRGDVVVTVDGQEIKSSSQLIPVLTGSQPHQKLALVILRDGWRKAVDVTLGDLPREARAERRAPAAKPEPAPLPPAKERGFLGVYLRQGDGGEAVVEGVLPDSPAAKAGLRSGDRVVAVNGKVVTDPAAMIVHVGQAGPGDTVEIKVAREGRELTLKALLTRRPGEDNLPPVPPAQPSAPAPAAPQPADGKKPFIGVALEDAGGAGPLKVDDVRANGPADRFGVRKGDVIVAVDKQPTKSIEDFVKAMQGKAAGQKVVFRVERDGWQHDVPVVLGAGE